MGLSSQTSVKWPIWIATSTADVGILTGVTVLLAWALNLSALKSVFPGSSPMAPGTAVGFILAGISLRARSAGLSVTGGRLLRIISRVAAAALALMGALRLGQYFIGMNLHLDLLFFSQFTPGAGLAQMSEITCFAFILLGAALALVDAPYSIAFHVAVLLGGLSGWVGLSRYLFGGEPVLPFKFMVFHTSINFLLLNAGVLCLRTDWGLMAVLTSQGSGGHVARRLVPATLLLVPLAGWILLEGQRASLYGIEACVALFSLSTVLLLGGLIWFNTARLDRAQTADGAVRESLRENRELMRAIVESSDDAIIGTTLSGMITTWNRSATKLFGYSADEAVGKSILMLIPPDRINEQNEILRKIAGAESTDHLETVRVRKDGAPIEVSVTLSPIRDMSGAIIGASEIARDITARNHEARKIQTQLSRMDLLSRITRAIGERQDLKSIYQVVIRSVEDQLPVDFGCICTYDSIDKVFSFTSVGVKSEGVWGEMAPGQQIRIPIDQASLTRSLAGELVYEPDVSKITSSFTDRLAGAGLRSVVIAPLSVESEVFGVLAVARREPESFSSAECEFLEVLSAHTAVAAHQAQLYGALQRAYEDLRQTQQAVMQQERLRALGEMASGVAHDINNGLSPILLYTSLLLEREKNLSDTAREYLKTVHRAGSDIAATISRLHEFYRPREAQLVLEPVHLNLLVPQVISLTRARWHDVAQQRGLQVELRMELSPALPLIMGVESEIREALVNLILNAVDAMPGGGTITLSTSASAASVSVQVADTGAGMDEETRGRCLEPFFTTKGERGTGLGLAMVYGIVKRHSGEIEINSEPGKGTAITLAFPAARTASSESHESGGRAAPLPRQRLLVVDDDPMILKALQDTLEGDGHIVVTAHGGQAGIDAFKLALSRDQPFSAVITDLGMPSVDGRAVARAIKAISPVTPVILLTGWGRRLKAEGEIPAHVDSLLSKPPKPAELREALARHLATRYFRSPLQDQASQPVSPHVF